MADEPDPPDEAAPDGGFATSDNVQGGNPAGGQALDFAVEFPDTEGLYAFGVSVAVAWDSGLGFAALAAGPRAKTAFWRVCAESSYKVVSFSAARMEAAPPVPHIDTGDPNDVLVRKSVSVPQADVVNGDFRGYMITGTYVYRMQVPADAESDPITIPNHVLGLDGGVMQLYPQTFRRDLLGIPTPPKEYGGSVIDF